MIQLARFFLLFVGFLPQVHAQIRPFKEFTLKNGLNVLVVEDSALPYFSIGLTFRVGSSWDPAGKKGLANLTAQLMDQGTTKRSATEIADAFGVLGTSFDAAVDSDSTSFSASTISTQRDQLLELFSEQILSPAFREADLQRVRSEIQSRLKQWSDSPASFLARVYAQQVFGPHSYGTPAVGLSHDLAGIRRADVVRFGKLNYRPNNAILTVAGRVPADIQNLLEQRFGTWGSHNSKRPSPVEVKKEPARIWLVHKADQTQAQIRLGHVAFPRNSTDFLVARVFNNILGVGFSSRLMNTIRDDLGLTYSISSSFDCRLESGKFEIGTFTRNEKVAETIRRTRDILNDLKKNGVKDSEVQVAKGYLIGTFPRAVETAEDVLGNLALLRLMGVPDTYLTNYRANIEAITTEKVNQFIKKYLDPQALQISIFANKEAVQGQLSELGIPIEVRNFNEFQ